MWKLTLFLVTFLVTLVGSVYWFWLFWPVFTEMPAECPGCWPFPALIVFFGIAPPFGIIVLWRDNISRPGPGGDR